MDDEHDEDEREHDRLFLKAETSHNWAGWAEAFTIFAKYATGSKIDGVCATHDQVLAGPRPAVVTPEDRARLLALGWRVDRHLDSFARFT